MGRHSVPGSPQFRLSLLRAAAKWGILLAVVAAGLLVWRLATRDGEAPSGGVPAPTTPVPAHTVPASPSPSLQPSPSPSPAPSASPSPSVAPTGEALQVLDGAELAGSGTRAAAVLREKGFNVVSVADAVRRYRQTTVFYQPGFQALAQRAGKAVASTVLRPAPQNLDRSIPVTVVVGDDFRR